MFCGLFLINPVGQYITRNTHAWINDDTLFARMRTYKIYIMCIALTGAAISGAWSIQQNLNLQHALLYTTTVFALVTSGTWNTTTIFMLNMIGKRSTAVLWAGISTTTGLAISYILVTIFETGASWLLGQAAGMAIGSTGAAKALHLSKLTWSKEPTMLFEKGSIRNYVFPLAISTGFMWFIISGYKLVIESNWGLAKLGVITVGLSLASQIWNFFESIAMQYLYPYYYKSISMKDTEISSQAFNDTINILGPIYLVLLSFSVISAASLQKIIISTQYNDALYYIILGTIFETIRAITNLISIGAQIDNKMTTTIPPYAIGSILLLFGLMINANNHTPVKTAALTLIASALAMLFSMYYLISIKIKIYIDWRRWLFGVAVVGLSLTFIEISTPQSILNALQITFVSGVLHLGLIITLTRKNTTLLRLTSKKLGANEEERNP